MFEFSHWSNGSDDSGEVVLEALLTSSIESIIDLDLSGNSPWFQNPGNVDLLAEVISKQAGIHHIKLCDNKFSSDATQKILSRIADHPSTTSKL